MNNLLTAVDRMINIHESLASLIDGLADRLVPHATASAGCPTSYYQCKTSCGFGKQNRYFCSGDPCAGYPVRCTFQGCRCGG